MDQMSTVRWLCAATLLAAACRESTTGLDKAGQAFVDAQQALAAGDKDRARELLDVSIRTRPDPWAYFQRAQLHAEAGNDDAAQADCREGLRLDPEHSDLLWLEKELDKPSSARFQGRNAKPPSDSK
jgi:Tfp pilus assembly protein PilF